MIRVASRMVPVIELKLGATFRRWVMLARQRHDLGTLDAARLDDLGLTRAEATAEAERPFWDAPDNWRI